MRAKELRWRHPDDRERVAKNADDFADSDGIESELPFPEAVADDGDRVAAGYAVIIGGKDAAGGCSDA